MGWTAQSWIEQTDLKSKIRQFRSETEVAKNALDFNSRNLSHRIKKQSEDALIPHTLSQSTWKFQILDLNPACKLILTLLNETNLSIESIQLLRDQNRVFMTLKLIS
jgi:hypothetical protein